MLFDAVLLAATSRPCRRGTVDTRRGRNDDLRQARAGPEGAGDPRTAVHGHVVGYLGDGINDGPALAAADVGISVESAVDVAKGAADIILLEKSLPC